MNVTKILVLIILTFCGRLNAQVQCSTITSQEEIDEIISSLVVTDGCEDDFEAFDIEEDITFNLLLRYARDSNGNGGLEMTTRNAIQSAIENFYDDYHILFNITWIPLDDDGYLDDPESWPPRDNGCGCYIMGDIDSNFSSSYATLGGGKFQSELSASTINHEIGHALGLIHTHGPTNGVPGDPLTSEHVTRTNTSSCDCNCLLEGDLVCDTPADPLRDVFDDFVNGCVFDNDGTKDNCNVLFSDPNNLLPKNLMGYHTDCTQIELTPGQNLMIRRSMSLANGEYKFACGEPEYTVVEDWLIDDPNLTVISGDYVVNGKMTINSDVRFVNCGLYFTDSADFMDINPGTKVEVINSIISDDNITCPPSNSWNGIRISGGSVSDPTEITIKDNSLVRILNGRIGMNGHGNLGGLRYDVIDSEMETTTRFVNVNSVVNFQNTLFDNVTNRSLEFSGCPNVYIQGCTFEDGLFSSGPVIESYNSGLRILDLNGQRTEFLNEGTNNILFESNEFNFFTVSNTNFNRSKKAIVVNGAIAPVRINNCSFVFEEEVGITLNNALDFNIYSNFFVNQSVANPIMIKGNFNQNSNPNTIINNGFIQGISGIVTDGDFGSAFGGVEFRCNHSTAISNYNISRTGDINPLQGSVVNAAGNTFSYSGFANGDFHTGTGSSNPVNYFFVDVDNQEPIEFNGISVIETVNSSDCTFPTPPSLPDPPFPTEKNMFKEFLDGGNSDDVINFINTNSNTNPTLVVNVLTGLSPFVSIDAISTLFDNSNNFTEEEVVDLLVLNPSVIQDNYINYVVFESGSFGQANQQSILNAYYLGDELISLTDSVNNTHKLIGENVRNNIITNGYDYSLGKYDWSFIRSEVSKKITDMKCYQLLETYISERNWNGANAEIIKQSNSSIFDPIARIEKEAYLELAQIQVNLGNEGMIFDSIATNDRILVEEIANNYYGLATVKARSLLGHHFNMNFTNFPLKPIYSGITFRVENRNSKNELGQEEYVVSPNPASNSIAISLPRPIENLNLSIISLTGESLANWEFITNERIIEIDVTDLPNGVYFCQLESKDVILETIKIVIVQE